MKLLYQAKDTLEAHMILNLLKNKGIDGRVDGEYLQGGIGELQADGLVRVMVSEQYFEQARSLIDDWESAEVSLGAGGNEGVNRMSRVLFSSGFGFLLGVAMMLFYFQTPVSTDGVDYDGDGVDDEKWFYKNNLIYKGEVDRDFDRRVDERFFYDRKGLLESSSNDLDFDGQFETDSVYRNGVLKWSHSDSDGDGFYEIKMRFKYGVLTKIDFYDPDTQKIRKTIYYDAFRAIRSEFDRDNDGVMDEFVEYDEYENPVLDQKSRQ